MGTFFNNGYMTTQFHILNEQEGLGSTCTRWDVWAAQVKLCYSDTGGGGISRREILVLIPKININKLCKMINAIQKSFIGFKPTFFAFWGLENNVLKLPKMVSDHI